MKKKQIMLLGCRQLYSLHKNREHVDIAKYVKTRFDTSNYELERPLPNGKIKKVTGLMKDELDGKIMTEFVALKPKTCSYLTDDSDENKKKAQKSVLLNENLNLKIINIVQKQRKLK